MITVVQADKIPIREVLNLYVIKNAIQLNKLL